MTGEWARLVLLLDGAQLECVKLSERLDALTVRLENIRVTLGGLLDQVDQAKP